MISKGKASVEGNEYEIVVSRADVKNAPVTIYINQHNNKALGEYVYTISGYSSTLYGVDNTNSALTTLSQLLNKKLGRPVYLNVNGLFSDTTVVPMFREIMELGLS